MRILGVIRMFSSWTPSKPTEVPAKACLAHGQPKQEQKKKQKPRGTYITPLFSPPQTLRAIHKTVIVSFLPPFLPSFLPRKPKSLRLFLALQCPFGGTVLIVRPVSPKNTLNLTGLSPKCLKSDWFVPKILWNLTGLSPKCLKIWLVCSQNAWKSDWFVPKILGIWLVCPQNAWNLIGLSPKLDCS